MFVKIGLRIFFNQHIEIGEKMDITRCSWCGACDFEKGEPPFHLPGDRSVWILCRKCGLNDLVSQRVTSTPTLAEGD